MQTVTSQNILIGGILVRIGNSIPGDNKCGIFISNSSPDTKNFTFTVVVNFFLPRGIVPYNNMHSCILPQYVFASITQIFFLLPAVAVTCHENTTDKQN